MDLKRVNPEQLTEADTGRWVVYIAPHGAPEIGRLKSWREDRVFVVYHASDEWDNYQNYTGQGTVFDEDDVGGLYFIPKEVTDGCTDRAADAE